MWKNMMLPSAKAKRAAILAACVLAFGVATACEPWECDDCGYDGSYHHDRGEHHGDRGGGCDSDDYGCR